MRGVAGGNRGVRVHPREGSRARRSWIHAVTLFVVIAALTCAVIAVPMPAAAGPSGPCLTCVCLRCGSCPTGSSLGLTVSVQASSTNVTVDWEPTIDLLVGTWANVTFGNTTSYGFSAVNNSYASGSNVNGVDIDFLEPETTYYYKIVAWGYCDGSPKEYYHQTYTGSWTTYSDSSETISGQVVDANGAAAPSGIELEVRCADTTALGIDYPSTSAGGYNSVQLLGNLEDCEQDGGYLVTAYAQPTLSGAGYASWPDHWNETIVTWAPQVVNFDVPVNYLSSYVPTILDYADSPAAQGYTDITAATGAGVSESYTYSWSVGAQVLGISGGASGSQTTSEGRSWQSGIENNEGILCYAVQYDVSGTAQFTAQSREWSFSQDNFDPQNGDYCANTVGFTVPQPWIHNSTAGGAYYLDGPPTSKYASGLTNVTLWQGEVMGNESGFVVSGEVQTGISYGFSLDFGLPGAPSVGTTVSEQWSESVSESASWSFTVSGESQTAVSCYNVLGSGGSQSHNDAAAIAIYYWQGYTEMIDGVNYPFCN
jgi:hypothetical protein